MGAYVLKEIFQDFYEHEVYFSLVSSVDLVDICPSRMEVELSSQVSRTQLYFPEDCPDLLRIIVPLPSKKMGKEKREKLSEKNVHHYADLVLKIRLSLKNQMAALRKDLVNPHEEKVILSKIQHLRQEGLKNLHIKMEVKGGGEL